MNVTPVGASLLAKNLRAPRSITACSVIVDDHREQARSYRGPGCGLGTMADSISMKKLVTRLLLVVVAMFVFGFALVPIYDVMCKAFGINGKTAGQYEGEQTVDTSRQVRVQFLSTN